MFSSKSDIIKKLQKEILPLQGFKTSINRNEDDIALGPIKFAFPNARFPLGAIHELHSNSKENAAATNGFISGILSSLMKKGGVTIWISSSKTVFPPALRLFGINPEKIIFIQSSNSKELLWIVEEGLKCNGLAAVVCELNELDFTTSRRLQLAVEQSRVTGFIHCINPRNINTTASVTRWKISPIPSYLNSGMPGLGFPKWNVELLKVRNGKTGEWQVEWSTDRFRYFSLAGSVPEQVQKKAG